MASQTNRFIVEPSRELPVSGSHDVVVCGEAAGTAAALAVAQTESDVQRIRSSSRREIISSPPSN